ncbi:MAG: YceI family protein [Candidatus Kapabacteria bacterium]|nr:YceI family protein [Candidatus Kapabacteria bacterium]MDW8011944.1 YceI family protein [Bacteroidota bacterium]
MTVRLISCLLTGLLALSSTTSAATRLPLPVNQKKTVTLSNNVGPNLCKFLSSAPLEEFEGTADGISGSFTVDPSNLEATSGRIQVTVASMRTGITRRDEHLRSPEWLDAERYPTISFDVRELKEVRITEQSRDRATLTAKAVGTFTLHGVSKPMELPITLTYVLENLETRKRAPGDFVMVQSEFTISLRDFNIRGRQGIVGSRVGETIRVWVTLYGSTAASPTGTR